MTENKCEICEVPEFKENLCMLCFRVRALIERYLKPLLVNK